MRSNKTQIGKVVYGGVGISGTPHAERAELLSKVIEENPDGLDIRYNGIPVHLDYVRSKCSGRINEARGKVTEEDFLAITGLVNNGCTTRAVKCFDVSLDRNLEFNAYAYHRDNERQNWRCNIHMRLPLSHLIIK